MITLIIELAVVVIGFMAAAVLFYRIPKLPEAEAPAQSTPAVSIVIPARNEEKNLDLLLRDLTLQTLRPLEIICVDDASEDRTAEVARAYGVRVLSVKDKPEDWTGKTWACQQGAEAAGGNLLLFLDADVRLGRRGLEKLMSARRKSGGTISVQPYHRTEKNYEQLSLVFNLVQIAANGTAL
jgi:4,4'-diaponeurosporenoate glycosyltransferase